MKRSVRQVSQIRNLIRDFHPKERKLIKDTMFVHFSRNQIQVELAYKACWAVILDNLDNALINLFIINYFLLKAVSVDPLDKAWLITIFGH